MNMLGKAILSQTKDTRRRRQAAHHTRSAVVVCASVAAASMTMIISGGCKTTSTSQSSPSSAAVPVVTRQAMTDAAIDQQAAIKRAAAEAAARADEAAAAEADARRAVATKAAKVAAEAKAEMERAEVAAQAAAKAKAEAAARAAAEAKAAAEAAATRAADEHRRAEEARRQAEIEAAEARRRAAARAEEERVRREAEDRQRAAAAAQAAAEMAAAIVPAPRQPATALPTLQVGSIRGSVALVTERATGSDDVFVVAEPMDSAMALVAGGGSTTHNVEMSDKKFRPKFLLIRVGDTVRFKNLDAFQHNVFSLTGNNKFDLGTYGRGTEPTHTFAHPGVVKVYCNIHPDMACFIMASAHKWGAVTDAGGEFDLSGLPPGKYTLKAWSVRGEAEAEVEVLSGQTAAANLEIDGSRYKRKQHRNKHGKRYKKSQDEFY